MKILVAPDSFKGSLPAQRFCEITERVFANSTLKVNVTSLPMADGGEGTMMALVHGTGGSLRYCKVTGPLGRQVEARYGFLGDGTTAVVEMAESSGLPLVPEKLRDPLKTTSYGTGELIRDALDHGAEKILLGLGGSATNDGGVGALQALGFRFNDKYENQLISGGGELSKLARIDISTADSRLKNIKIQIASDVTNPLLGQNGATNTYGRQKGADDSAIISLEKGLERLADLSEKVTGLRCRDIPGSGAAGGMGFGFLVFCGAAIESGFELVARTYDLENSLKKQDFALILTGEGEVNFQTSQGKLVGRIAKLGKKYSIPVIVYAGAINGDVKELYNSGVISMQSIVPEPVSLENAMANAEEYLERKLVDLIQVIEFIKAP